MNLPINDQEKLRKIPWSLAHITLNNFFFTWTFGSSIFTLFLSELNLPKDKIGMLLSFFPFAGIVSLFIAPQVARWGRKRIFLFGYGLRKPVMASLLLLPWLISRVGYQAAVVFLIGVILSVALLRSLAETAYFPWFQEYVPNAIRGKYAMAATLLTTLTSIVALAIASQVIDRYTGLNGYMSLIGIGAAIGVVGVGMMAFVPGGDPKPGIVSPQTHVSNLAQCLRDRNFLLFLGGMSCYSLAAYTQGAFLPLFLKEHLRLAPESVVNIEIFSMVGGAIASILAGILADRKGSRAVMIPGLALSIITPIGWLGISLFQGAPFLPTASANTLSCSLLFFYSGAVSTIASIGSSRLLYNNVIPVEKNTSYTSLYYTIAGLMGGSAPLVAGHLLDSMSGWSFPLPQVRFGAFQVLFVISLALFFIAFLLYRRVCPD